MLRAPTLPAWAIAAAIALAALAALLSALWPTAALVAGAVAVVLALCLRAPAYAFLGALVLYGFEGTIKMRLSVEGAPSAVGLGAALLDLAFLASLAALLLQDRGRSLLQLWTGCKSWERVAVVLLAAWLCVSVIQIPVGGDLVDGLEGFRLTQLYVPAVLGGIVLASRLGAARLGPLLLGIVALATVYAAIRGIVGPSFNEQAFAELRTYHTEFGDLGRNVGSFTAPVGLASFLVPVALLSLIFGFLAPAYRQIAWALFVLAMTGIIASYVRTAFVAVVVGVALFALLIVLAGGGGGRRKAYAVGLVALVLGGGYAGTLVAGEVEPQARERARSLANPFADQSLKERLDLWERSLDKVAANPLGTGLGTLGRASLRGRRARHTDNSYLKILQEQGIPGALLFLTGLGGILVAVAVRLRRRDMGRHPLGTAAFVGFGGFLVVMVTGEYIEQPGKLLAWTLLGVAIWEAAGRAGAAERQATPRLDAQRISALARRLRARATRLPGPVVGLVLGCAAGAGLLAIALAATRETDYHSASLVRLPVAGVGDPQTAAALGAGFVQGALDRPDFQARVVEDVDFVRSSEVPERVRLSTRRLGERWEFRLTASGPSPEQARELVRKSSGALRALRGLHRAVLTKLERDRLRTALRRGDLDRMARTVARRRYRRLTRNPPEPTARLTVPTEPIASDQPLDRLASAVAGDAAASPNIAWAGLGGVFAGLAMAVSVLILIVRGGPSATPQPRHRRPPH